ncbi:MAG: hypothetical protein ACRECH_05945 [Nitrososphaerales archaeon]
MTAYFTDPMSDEFKKALQKVLKRVEKSGEEDPDAIKRAGESKKKGQGISKKGRKPRLSKEDAKRLR